MSQDKSETDSSGERSDAAAAPTRPLSGTQRAVVRLLALGCSVAEVAQVLGISENTADNHKSRAMQRLGLHKISLLTRTAIETGISPVGDSLNDYERHRLAAIR